MPRYRHLSSFMAMLALAFCLTAARADAAEQINFDSAARDSNVLQVFQGKAAYTDHIHGELRLPSKGAAPFAAMVILHSSRGIDRSIGDWARLFNDMGIATMAVDSFGPRGLAERNADQLSFPAGVVDALRAFQALQRDPKIDAARIGVIGFSRGAFAAMDSSFERYRAAVLGADAGKFALHVVFYGGCGQYAKTTGSPILAFVGTADDFNNIDLCRRNAEALKQQGADMELVVYDGAPHGFDTGYPLQSMPMVQNTRNCRMLQNLDTFAAVLPDGRVLSPDERLRYMRTCPGQGAARGGDRKYAEVARARVMQFVGDHLK